MPVVITEEVTLADIDETIAYVNQLLKTDTYGNRMDWKKKEDLQMSIDELLDARINLMNTGRAFIEWERSHRGLAWWNTGKNRRC